jgi:hypothetical protein
MFIMNIDGFLLNIFLVQGFDLFQIIPKAENA